MKLLTTALLLALLIGGCGQVIIETDGDKTRLKINTLFKNIVTDGFYYDKDPNGIVTVGNYEGKGDPNSIEASGALVGKMIQAALTK